MQLASCSSEICILYKQTAATYMPMLATLRKAFFARLEVVEGRTHLAKTATSQHPIRAIRPLADFNL